MAPAYNIKRFRVREALIFDCRSLLAGRCPLCAGDAMIGQAPGFWVPLRKKNKKQ